MGAEKLTALWDENDARQMWRFPIRLQTWTEFFPPFK